MPELRPQDAEAPVSELAPTWFNLRRFRQLVSSDGQFYVKERHNNKEFRVELAGGSAPPAELADDELQFHVIRHLDNQLWRCRDCGYEAIVIHFLWSERRCPQCWSLNINVLASEVVPPRPRTFGTIGGPVGYSGAPITAGHIWGGSGSDDGNKLTLLARYYRRKPQGDSYQNIYLLGLFGRSLVPQYQSRLDRFNLALSNGNVIQNYFRATGSPEAALGMLDAFEEAIRSDGEPIPQFVARHSFAMAVIFLLDAYDEHEADRVTHRPGVRTAAIASLRTGLRLGPAFEAHVESKDYASHMTRARYALADLLTRGAATEAELREALAIFGDLDLSAIKNLNLEVPIQAAMYQCQLALPLPPTEHEQEEWIVALNNLDKLIEGAMPSWYQQRWRWALEAGQWLMRVGEWHKARPYLESAVTFVQKDYPAITDPGGLVGNAEQFYKAYRALATNYIGVGWAFEGLALLETYRGKVLEMAAHDRSTRLREGWEAERRRSEYFQGPMAGDPAESTTLIAADETLGQWASGSGLGPFDDDYELPGLLDRIDRIRERLDDGEPTALIALSIDTTTTSSGAWLSVVVIRPPSAEGPPTRCGAVHLNADQLEALHSQLYRRPGSFRERRLWDMGRRIRDILLAPAVEHLADFECRRALIAAPGAFSNLPFDASVDEDGNVLFRHTALVPSFMFGHDLPLAELPGAGARVLVTGYSGSDLRYADEEAAAICELFGDRATYLHGASCTKKTIVEYLNGEFDYVHFICHGSYDEHDPLQSALHFREQEGTDTFRLRASEIEQFVNMPRRPVVSLSACSTALTADSRSNTWNGLPGALLRSGARALVGTRWPVRDIAASSMMRSFYEHVAAGDKTPLQAFFAAQDAHRHMGAVEDWACFGYLGLP